MATRPTRSPRSRKPKPARIKIKPGNGSDIEWLRRAWRRGELVLCLGAGVSMPYGLPSWNNLILELLFEQAQATKQFGTMWPHYRRAVAAWMTDYFAYNPLVLARMVEREMRTHNGGNGVNAFLQRLRKHLYVNHRRPSTRTALESVADLIAKPSDGGRVAAVISFNFDDLLERELVRRRVPHRSISDGRRNNRSGLSVIHAHGYLPELGTLSRKNVVFTEDDYHRLTDSVFHWALAEIVERLRKNTVLFIGLSMSDPSLRRLLDASRNSNEPPHWQLQRRHRIRDHELSMAMEDVEKRAQKYAEYLGSGFDDRKRPDELEESINAALEQADTYDREVFESMGVKTIWVDEFDDICGVIDAIST